MAESVPTNNNWPLETTPGAGSPKMPFEGSEGTLYHVLFSVLKASEPMVPVGEYVRIFEPTTMSRSW